MVVDLVKVLFIGDIIGRPGRIAVRELLPRMISNYGIDFVVANGENAAGGFGITPSIVEELLDFGVDVITSGNHIWDKKEIVDYIGSSKRLLRPANYPDSVPGTGYNYFNVGSYVTIGVVNLSGRVFMDNLDCPFMVGNKIVESLRKSASVIIVDFHAEATSEKSALGWFMDGKVSAVLGSHTHVQTADERILPGGTAFISDAGMTGSTNSVIGVQREDAIHKFLTQMPKKFTVATKEIEFQGVLLTIRVVDGKAVGIERLKVQI